MLSIVVLTCVDKDLRFWSSHQTGSVDGSSSNVGPVYFPLLTVMGNPDHNRALPQDQTEQSSEDKQKQLDMHFLKEMPVHAK